MVVRLNGKIMQAAERGEEVTVLKLRAKLALDRLVEGRKRKKNETGRRRAEA